MCRLLRDRQAVPAGIGCNCSCSSSNWTAPESDLCLCGRRRRATRSLEPDGFARDSTWRSPAQMRPSSIPPRHPASKVFRREKIDLVRIRFFPAVSTSAPSWQDLGRAACVAGFQNQPRLWLTRRDRWFGANQQVGGRHRGNCDAAARARRGRWRVPRESVTIIPNSVDLSRFSMLRQGAASSSFKASHSARRRRLDL